ncbi:MAG: SDR family oxidoreductase [Solirubrobacteraceae bacterium]
MPPPSSPPLARTAIVTGAASGIGLAIAQRLANDGARVVVGDISLEAAERAAHQIEADGGVVTAIQADVSKVTEVDQLVERTVETYGGLDVMVNNAGIEGDASLRKLQPELFDRVIGINLGGVFNGCRAAAAVMDGHGRIVNIASRAWLGWWGQAAYAASKGGVVSLTRALAVELSAKGITVNCVAPGLIDSPMLRKVPKTVYDNVLAAQPSGEVGTTDDVAHLVRFLVDDRAKAITGQILYSCGGKSLFAMPARRPSTSPAERSAT